MKEENLDNNDEYITIDISSVKNGKSQKKKTNSSTSLPKGNRKDGKTNGKRVKEESPSTKHKPPIRRKQSRVEKNPDNPSNSKKKMPLKKKIIIGVAIFIAIIATLGIIFGVYVFKAEGNITEAVLNVASDILGTDEPIFVLVLGMSEDISAQLTDTIILCGYNPESQKAFMLSIPRDTFVGNSPSYAGGYDKINAAYQTDIKKTVESVEKLTGIDIDNYVLVRNTALPAIVEAIGEVEFEVPIDMNYDDPTQDLHIHLNAGLQMIDKNEAEQLLRFRKNNDGTSYPVEYGDNDYGRMRTQREFIKAVARQLISNGSTNSLKDIATAVFNNVETDIALTKLISYIPSALKYDVETLRMEQLPGISDKLNSLYFYIANSNQTKKIMTDLIEFLELDEKETKKYFDSSLIRKQITVPKTEDTSNTEVEHTNTVSTTNTTNITNTSNIVNNTTNNVVNNSVSNNSVSNNTTNTTNTTNITNTTTNNNTHECTFDAGTVTTEPTCSKEGIKTYTCTDATCGKTKTTSVPATGKHIISDGKCTNPTCNYIEAPAHVCTFDGGTVTTSPTCTTPGVKTYTCTDATCGKTKTESISATGHTMDGGTCACGYTETPPVTQIPSEEGEVLEPEV